MADAENKLAIAKTIVSMCTSEKSKLNAIYGYKQLFALCTGHEPNELLFHQNCSFKEFTDIKYKKPENRKDLRKYLAKWYLKLRKIPKLEDIISFAFLINEGEVDRYFYSATHEGFVWKNIPGTPKAMFIEKFENIAKRLKYLIKMKEYRQQERHIVYLEDFTYKKNFKVRSFIAISNKYGVLSVVRKCEDGFESYNYLESGLKLGEDDIDMTNKPENLQFKLLLSSTPKPYYCSTTQIRRYSKYFLPGSDSSDKILRINWIKDILKMVTEPAVFVYEDFPFSQQDLIPPFSTKFVMKEYLDENGIPYARNAHRFELHNLIKKYTKNKRDDFTEFICSHKHDALLIPHGFEDLDFYHWFWPDDGKEDFSAQKIIEAEKALIEAEDNMLTEDRMMEVVVDKVMTMGQCEGKLDDDLTNYVDVMKYDCEYGHNSLFFD